MFDLMIKGGTVLLPDGEAIIDVAIKEEKIVKLGVNLKDSSLKNLDGRGLHVLPGVIDTQVHFRDPGMEHKEDFETGSLGAVIGGVTAVFDMPNTKPSTTSLASLKEKFKRIQGRAWCDYGLYVGATHDNIAELSELEKYPGVCGVKIFVGSSTGDLLVADEISLKKIFKSTRRRLSFHSEDNDRLIERKKNIPHGAKTTYHPMWRDEESAFISTERLVRLAEEYQHPIHILHVSSKREIEFLAKHKNLVTAETLPQYLVFCAPDIYERLGTLAQMNPPIRSIEHQNALWQGIQNKTVDVLATDHAPHTREEKQKPYPESPAGMTGVQTLVPIMLDQVRKGHLKLRQFVELASLNPAKIWNLKDKGEIRIGRAADFTIVDLKKSQTVTDHWIKSKCGWSPYSGLSLTGWPVGTVVRGHVAMWQGQALDTAIGKPLDFNVASQN